MFNWTQCEQWCWNKTSEWWHSEHCRCPATNITHGTSSPLPTSKNSLYSRTHYWLHSPSNSYTCNSRRHHTTQPHHSYTSLDHAWASHTRTIVTSHPNYTLHDGYTAHHMPHISPYLEHTPVTPHGIITQLNCTCNSHHTLKSHTTVIHTSATNHITQVTHHFIGKHHTWVSHHTAITQCRQGPHYKLIKYNISFLMEPQLIVYHVIPTSKTHKNDNEGENLTTHNGKV